MSCSSATDSKNAKIKTFDLRKRKRPNLLNPSAQNRTEAVQLCRQEDIQPKHHERWTFLALVATERRPSVTLKQSADKIAIPRHNQRQNQTRNTPWHLSSKGK